MKFLYVLSIFGLLLFSCDNAQKSMIDVSKIQTPFVVKRFDQDFYHSNAQTIASVRKEYPYLFPGNEPDSVWLRRKNDSLSKALFSEITKVFGDFKEQKQALNQVFKHVKFYYHNFKAPTVITLQSNLDLDHQVIYADSLLLISLDTYLGEKSDFYANYPTYLKRNFNKRMLPVHVAQKMVAETLPKIAYRVFVERMIQAGKLYYGVQEFIPEISQQDLWGYTPQQLQWAKENEEEIWKYFVEREYLFSTDKELKTRFLEPAPFSKFYLVTDNESPGQIGAWVGYRIVQSYMKNYDVSLPILMATSPEEIFKKSKYKPER